MDNIIRYNNFNIVNFNIHPDKSVGVDVFGYQYDKIRKKNPIIYFSKDSISANSPKRLIAQYTYYPYISSIIKDSTLYFSSKCNVPRDLVRNSGYKITYTFDKADFIVIPEPKEEWYYQSNMVVRNIINDDVYICRLIGAYAETTYDANFLMNKLACKLDVERFDLEHFELPKFQTVHVWRTQDLPEYERILQGDNSKRYIYESNLPLVPANTLSVETLDLWRRLAKSDDNLLDKSILNSDAREYPFTMYMFLYYDKAMEYVGMTQKRSWLMESMGIKNKFPSNVLIEPKDLNLIQDYIMYISGASENGGYITPQKYNELPYQYQKIIRSKFAIAPIRAKNPILYSDIKTIAENS